VDFPIRKKQPRKYPLNGMYIKKKVEMNNVTAEIEIQGIQGLSYQNFTHKDVPNKWNVSFSFFVKPCSTL
jgi:hypothetical protein